MSIASVAPLVDLLHGRRFAVLTGAGCSTESGVPDYRGPETRRRAANPVRFSTYVGDERARARYWARAVLGWVRFSRAQPNAGHRALAELEAAGLALGVVTQNVDRLHQAAGSRRVVELHGALAEVRCLECQAREPRSGLQQRLLELNPGWLERCAELLPDGDADLPPEVAERFRTTGCRECGGVQKPDVVFFGESVPRPVVEAGLALVDAAAALLVVGTSLAVYSGYRFVRRAAERGIPIAVVNLGSCRGEELASVRIDARAGEVLPELARALAAD